MIANVVIVSTNIIESNYVCIKKMLSEKFESVDIIIKFY